jgi:hypothetical protein
LPEVIDVGALRCSFCHKKDTEVSKLVAGFRGFICDECVAVASRLMEAPPDPRPPSGRPSLWQRIVRRVAGVFHGTGRHGMQSLTDSG